MVLEPFFLHGLSFLLGKLAVAVLVELLQDGCLPGFLGFLDVRLENGYFLVGKLAVLVGVILGHDQFFPDDHDAGINSPHLEIGPFRTWALAVPASGAVAGAFPSFRRGLHFRSVGRCVRGGGRRRVLSERGACGKGRGDNHLLGHNFEW